MRAVTVEAMDDDADSRYASEDERLTSPPARYVPTALVRGPTSNVGREKRNTRLGSYVACMSATLARLWRS